MVRLDSEDTWPTGLTGLLERNLGLLAAFEYARAERDRRLVDDVMARLELDTNPYRSGRDAVLVQCGEIVAAARLVGYHCTRLTGHEIASVREAGLRTLTPALFEGRIARVREEGLLPPGAAERVLALNAGRAANRAGMIWFVFRTEDLGDEGGLARLFAHWGGEALYGHHEADPVVGPALRSLGIPCIVEAHLPATGIESFATVEEWLMGAFLAARGIRTSLGRAMQGHTKDDVPASSIAAVITAADERFEHLTGGRSWGASPFAWPPRPFT